MHNLNHRDVLVLAGPTASGKSALALEVAHAIAEKSESVIINADAMQQYQEIPVITAQPSSEEQQQVPHVLYGVLLAKVHGTTAMWAKAAAKEVERCFEEGKTPFLVGGSGLYLQTLMHGIAPIPEVPDDVRQEVQAMMDTLGNEAFHQELAQVDAVIAAELYAGDTQRCLRAYEVWKGTGKPLSEWQKQPSTPVLNDVRYHAFFLDKPREEVYANINTRFPKMMEAGALQEVEALLEQNLPTSLPAMRSHGVPELTAYLKGEKTLEEAVEKACQVTRNYAKRQMTWFRGRMQDFTPVQSLDALLSNLKTC